MKSYLIALLLLFTFSFAFSQNKSNSIKVKPFGFAIGNYSIAYEQKIREKKSIQLEATFIDTKLFGTNISAFALTPEFRFYRNQALNKFYFAPLLKYGLAKLESTDQKSEISLTGGGAKIGWNLPLGKRNSFLVDLGIGIQYLSISYKNNSSNTDERGGITLPIVNLKFGYAF